MVSLSTSARKNLNNGRTLLPFETGKQRYPEKAFPHQPEVSRKGGECSTDLHWDEPLLADGQSFMSTRNSPQPKPFS